LNKTNAEKKTLFSRLTAEARTFLTNTRVTMIINAKVKQEVAKDVFRMKVT
jgi:hypothetical protein